MYPPGSAKAFTAGDSTTRELWALRGTGDPQAEILEVSVELVVGVDSHLGIDPLGLLEPDLELLCFADERELALACDGVPGTGGDEQSQKKNADDSTRFTSAPDAGCRMLDAPD